jgi:hypothetical protein
MALRPKWVVRRAGPTHHAPSDDVRKNRKHHHFRRVPGECAGSDRAIPDRHETQSDRRRVWPPRRAPLGDRWWKTARRHTRRSQEPGMRRSCSVWSPRPHLNAEFQAPRATGGAAAEYTRPTSRVVSKTGLLTILPMLAGNRPRFCVTSVITSSTLQSVFRREAMRTKSQCHNAYARLPRIAFPLARGVYELIKPEE